MYLLIEYNSNLRDNLRDIKIIYFNQLMINKYYTNFRAFLNFD